MRCDIFLIVYQRVIDGWNRVLPDEFFRRHFRAEIAGARTHVPMRELEPRAGERIGKLIGVLARNRREIFS